MSSGRADVIPVILVEQSEILGWTSAAASAESWHEQKLQGI